jgi:hypothetical protein
MIGTRFTSLALVATVALVTGCREEGALEPTAPLAPEASGAVAQEDIIPGQYIVVFKDDVGNPARLAGEMARANRLTLRHTYRHAFRGFSAVVPEGRLSALQKHPLVQYVQPNRMYYIDTHERLRGAAPSPVVVAAFTSAPANLSATVVSSTQIDLAWSDNSGNETSFEIERAPSATGPFAKIGSVKQNVTTYGDDGLEPNTEYCYQVRAVSGRGKNREYSGYSNNACATTQEGEPPPPPADNRPTDLTAVAASSSQIDLSWTDNWDAETGFEVERCGPVSPGGGCSAFSQLATVRADVTAYGDNGVSSGNEYCYQVRAYKKKGKRYEYTGYSNVACAEPVPEQPPTPPVAPSGLTATMVSSAAIDLAWLDESDNEDGFRVERCEGAGCGSFVEIGQVGAEVTSYSDDGLAASTTYTYRVFAYNAAGLSGYSNQASATTDDPPPPGQCDDTGNHDDVEQLWNIERVNAHLNPKWQATQRAGCEMKAWFFGLDSGVDSDHPDLNVAETVDFVGDGSGGEDGNGHGTHTAGTAAAVDGNGNAVGVAPGAPIYAFKVCDDGGSCPEDVVLAGIEEVTARKLANASQPMVANMSLGGIGTDELMETAVRRSINAGVVYSLSAGNGMLGICIIPYDSQDHTPSRVGDDDINAADGSDGDTKRVNGAIAVTSHDQSNADYDCNYGNPVTVAAPGVGVISTWLNGTYANLQGTSMAAPHGAGAAILYLQDHPNATPTQVEQAIVSLLASWTTDDTPNATGRLDVEKL